MLFVVEQAVGLNSLARALGVTAGALERAATDLASRPPPGLILQRHGRKLQLATDPSSAEFIRQLRGQADAQRLSRAALEVLSVIAYRQPATRAEIESVRGVNSDHALETLLARGIVEELGRRDTVGRPAVFGTTVEFLQLVGLRSLDELPPLEASRRAADFPPSEQESGEKRDESSAPGDIESVNN